MMLSFLYVTDLRVSFQFSHYTFLESDGQAVINVLHTGQAATDIFVSVRGGEKASADSIVGVIGPSLLPRPL